MKSLGFEQMEGEKVGEERERFREGLGSSGESKSGAGEGGGR